MAALLDAGFLATLGLFLFLLGVFVSWWLDHIPRVLSFSRLHQTRLYFGEEAEVELRIVNKSGWPLPWLQYSERLPLHLGYSAPFQGALYVPGHSQRSLRYALRGNQRGIFELGPLTVQYGDLFGFEGRRLRSQVLDYVVIYPRIVPLDELLLPSRTPLGTVRSRNPLSEDPLRVVGVRDYVPGDSIRQIHWPATARSGLLQVKKLEPAMTLETILIVDLHPQLYDLQFLREYTELAVVAAASFAQALIRARQAVGMLSNGVESPLVAALHQRGTASGLLWWDTPSRESEVIARGADARKDDDGIQPLLLRSARGNAQLLQVLEVLAGIETSSRLPLADMLTRHTRGLGWGVTLVIITGGVVEQISPKILMLQRAGYNVIAVSIGGRRLGSGVDGILGSAGIAVYRVRDDIQLIATSEALRG